MAATSSRHHSNHRSLSPSGRFCSSSLSSATSFTSPCTAASKSTASIFHRSSSPTRINLHGSPQLPQSAVKFSISGAGNKRTCLCSPTSHPGSFRCSFHRRLESKKGGHYGSNHHQTASYQPNGLNMRRSAMTNSLVRIGSVEGGEWVKRALATLIRPSSHHQRRRGDFRPRPSRLSTVTFATDRDNRR